MVSQEISADFPFNSRHIEVQGSRIHYVDEGSGNPIPFLHGNPQDMHELIFEYCQKLQQLDIRKLLMYATPGGIIDAQHLQWCKNHIRNLETVHIGEGMHYLQEDNLHLIGAELANWFKTL